MNHPMIAVTKHLPDVWKESLWLFVLLFFSTVSYGQKAEVLQFHGKEKQRSVCAGNGMSAGTISAITPLGAQSNDLSNNPIVLCFGDQIFINHTGDADFSDDPDLGTTPGVGYAFYMNQPSVSGPDLNTLTALDGGLVDMPMPINGVWVARGTPEGDVVFHNDGSIQNQFNGGRPIEMFFAPITITDFGATPPAFDDAGSCLHVSVDEWFSVLYLNEINLDDFSTASGALNGTLQVSGGMSELDGVPYDITLINRDDPSITGTLDAMSAHAGPNTFSVPSPGVYELTVTDTKGCSKTFVVSVPAADPVGLCMPDLNVKHDDEICVPVTVSNFNNISSFATTIAWDPNIVEFTMTSNINPALGTNLIIDVDNTDNGIIPLLWFDINPQTLADGDTLFEVCFRAQASPGNSTPVSFTDDPTRTEATDDAQELAVTIKSGSIRITVPDIPTVFQSVCADGSGTSIVSIQAFGGADPYTYRLIDQSDFSIFSDGTLPAYPAGVNVLNVPDGDYIIEIDNAPAVGGGGASDMFNVSGVPIMTTIDTIQPNCSNSMDGQISIGNIVGGQGPYTNTWITPGGNVFNEQMLDNLDTGAYQIIVTDLVGCTDTVKVQLAATEFSAVPNVLAQPPCEGEDGMVQIDVTGSSADYQYLFKDAADNTVLNITSPSGYVADLTTGNYTVIVGNGVCSDTVPFTLGARTQLDFVVDQHSSVSCNGQADGEIRLGVSGRNTGASLQFNWSPNVMNASGDDTSTVISQLVAGDYNLVVTDPTTMCTIDTGFTIVEPPLLQIRPAVFNPSCVPNASDGAIDLFLNSHGGTRFDNQPYEYLYRWYDLTDGRDSLVNDRNSQLRNLPEGLYGIVLIDANGCTDSISQALSSGPSISIITDQTILCQGDNTGQLSVQGDLAGNTIAWSTGASTETISNLAAGTYIVSVTEMDTSGTCVVSDTVDLTDPALNISVVRPMQFVPLSNCNEPDSGRIFNLELSGFSGPTSVVWNSLGDTTTIPFINVSAPGTYPFTVIDRLNDCELYRDSVDVMFPERISLDIDTTNVSCNGVNDGQVTINASGRGGAFDFIWSNGISETGVAMSQMSNLAADTLSVVVIESSDSTCTVPLTFQIREPDALDLLVDSSSTMNIRCFGDNNGQIQLIWEGGNRDAAPSITWTNNVAPNMLFADNLPAATYRVTLEDSRGCMDSVTVSITEPAEITAQIPVPQEPVCNGFQTVVTVDTAFGGTGSRYTFSVDNGPNQNLTSQIPVFSGEHLVTVFDEMGCRLDSMIFITEPAAIGVDLGADQNVSLGDSLRLTPDVDGIVPIDSFIWNPEEFISCQGCNSPFVSPEDDQVFEVIVIDANGCRGRDEVFVEVDKARKVYIPNAFVPNGANENEKWRIYSGAGVQRINGIHVFDRWGNLVFESGEEAPSRLGSSGWDGTVDGQLLRPGVYVYTVEVEFVDGRVLLYRGDVTLIQ